MGDMRLFKINEVHYAPKDQHESHWYLIAESDEAVYEYIDRDNFGIWADRNDQDEPPDERGYPIRSDDYDLVGHDSSYRDRLIRRRGDLGDDFYEPTDLYYGATEIGWEPGINLDDVQVRVLVDLQVAMVFRLGEAVE